MSGPIATSLTMSRLMCEWSAEVRNASTGMSASFLAEARSHATQHEQHTFDLIQRVRVYSANYADAVPDAGETSPRLSDVTGVCRQASFDRTRHQEH